MSRKMPWRAKRDRRAQALVEYALLIAGVALIAAAGVTIFGHKTTHMWNAVAAILPGAHTDDNGPIFAGQLIETTSGENGGVIQLNVSAIQNNSGTGRLGDNVLGPASGGYQGGNLPSLVIEAQ